MLDGFRHFPQGTTHTLPEGGLFVWAELPQGCDALKLLELAIQKNVAFVPGTHFYPEGGHMNSFRLNFSMQSVENIAEGMRRLGEAISEI